MKKNKSIKLITYIFGLGLIFPSVAYAYLDPGTGSYLFQIAAASILTLIFTFKNFKKQIIIFFKKIFHKKSTPDE